MPRRSPEVHERHMVEVGADPVGGGGRVAAAAGDEQTLAGEEVGRRAGEEQVLAREEVGGG